MSLDDSGSVQTRWFLRGGRKTEPPKYLDAADRRQYRAGRDAFLRRAGKSPARLPTGSTSWRALRRLAPALLVAAAVAGCMTAQERMAQVNAAQDATCRHWGLKFGTPEYANCRMELNRQQQAREMAADAEMQAMYARQNALIVQQLNRGQTCSYNGSTIGGITNGSVTCP